MQVEPLQFLSQLLSPFTLDYMLTVFIRHSMAMFKIYPASYDPTSALRLCWFKVWKGATSNLASRKQCRRPSCSFCAEEAHSSKRHTDAIENDGWVSTSTGPISSINSKFHSPTRWVNKFSDSWAQLFVRPKGLIWLATRIFCWRLIGHGVEFQRSKWNQEPLVFNHQSSHANAS